MVTVKREVDDREFVFKLSRLQLEDNINLMNGYLEKGRETAFGAESIHGSDIISGAETSVLSSIKIDQWSFKTKYPTFVEAGGSVAKKAKAGGMGSIQYKIEEYEDDIVYCPGNPSEYVCIINCLVKSGVVTLEQVLRAFDIMNLGTDYDCIFGVHNIPELARLLNINIVLF